MKILHIVLGLGRGGIGRLIADLAPVQVLQGHDKPLNVVSDFMRDHGIACMKVPAYRIRGIPNGIDRKRCCSQSMKLALVDQSPLGAELESLLNGRYQVETR